MKEVDVARGEQLFGRLHIRSTSFRPERWKYKDKNLKKS
jgi:hypothetical protein